ncbi:MAG: hypothetical protein JW757_09290 [Anaerolineales bacterium]|nr:hypothetical protein [Anaerolineales bacterium]
MTDTKQKFTRADWFKLFLICAFPLHLWTLLMLFRDVNWVAERTTMWDAIGFSGYALFYTLLESILLTGFIVLLSLLLPQGWNKTLRMLVLSLTAFVLSGWSILEQLILIVFYGRLRKFGIANPWLANDWVWGSLFVALIALSMAVPILLLRKNTKLQDNLNAFLNRLTTLSGLYLFLDAAGIVVIIIRNVTGWE